MRTLEIKEKQEIAKILDKMEKKLTLDDIVEAFNYVGKNFLNILGEEDEINDKGVKASIAIKQKFEHYGRLIKEAENNAPSFPFTVLSKAYVEKLNDAIENVRLGTLEWECENDEDREKIKNITSGILYGLLPFKENVEENIQVLSHSIMTGIVELEERISKINLLSDLIGDIEDEKLGFLKAGLASERDEMEEHTKTFIAIFLQSVFRLHILHGNKYHFEDTELKKLNEHVENSNIEIIYDFIDLANFVK